MAELDRVEADAALREAIGIWRTTPVEGTQDLVDAATDLLVVGVDSPSLRVLAGTSPRESQFVIEPLLVSVLEELGLSELLDGSDARAGLEARLRRLLDGRMTLRAVTSWAHGSIGHEGDAACQGFVLLDDIYDDWESSGQDLQHLEDVACGEAEAFLAGEPSRGFEDLRPPSAP